MGEEVSKGEVANITNAQDNARKLGFAMDALFQVLGLNRWGERTADDIETDPAKIRSAINDFKTVAEKILLGSDEEIKKTFAEIEKSGRKISGDRLTRLKNIQMMLNEVLSGLEDTEGSKEGEELMKEEVQKTVEETLQKALSPLKERIEKIENARGVSNKVPEEKTVEKSSNDFWEGIF